MGGWRECATYNYVTTASGKCLCLRLRVKRIKMQEFSLWQVLVLAVVQGVTEFIPVSSDGHLALIEPLIWRGSAPLPNSMDLTIVLHLGTLGSILVYYRQRILRLLGE